MNSLKALIGLARERLTEASRVFPRSRPPATEAASLSDTQRTIAVPAEAGENERGAAEDGHKAAWFRRKDRDNDNTVHFTIHFTIRMAATKSIRMIGCGARGRGL